MMSKPKGTEGIKRQAQELIDQAYERGFKDGKEVFVVTEAELVNKSYQQGLDDAWECARKMVCDVANGGMSGEQLYCVLGTTIYNDLFNFHASEAIERIRQYEEQKKAEEVKVGTRVRTIKDKDNAGTTLFPVGTIGVVKEIDTSTNLPYLISTDNDTFYYSMDMFEVIGDDEVNVGDEVVYHEDKGVVVLVANNGNAISVMSANGGWMIRTNRDEVVKTNRHFPQIAEVLEKMKEGEE